MANWKLIEGAAQAVRDYLATNVQAQITAVVADYGDAMTPGTVAHVVLSEMVEDDALANLSPIIEVLGDTTDDFQMDGSSAGFLHKIVVIGTLMDDTDAGEEKANFKKRVYRLARAVVLTLRAAQKDSINSSGYQLTSFGSPMVSYAPAIRKRGTSMVVGGFEVIINVTNIEIG